MSVSSPPSLTSLPSNSSANGTMPDGGPTGPGLRGVPPFYCFFAQLKQCALSGRVPAIDLIGQACTAINVASVLVGIFTVITVIRLRAKSAKVCDHLTSTESKRRTPLPTFLMNRFETFLAQFTFGNALSAVALGLSSTTNTSSLLFLCLCGFRNAFVFIAIMVYVDMTLRTTLSSDRLIKNIRNIYLPLLYIPVFIFTALSAFQGWQADHLLNTAPQIPSPDSPWFRQGLLNSAVDTVWVLLFVFLVLLLAGARRRFRFYIQEVLKIDERMEAAKATGDRLLAQHQQEQEIAQAEISSNSASDWLMPTQPNINNDNNTSFTVQRSQVMFAGAQLSGVSSKRSMDSINSTTSTSNKPNAYPQYPPPVSGRTSQTSSIHYPHLVPLTSLQQSRFANLSPPPRAVALTNTNSLGRPETFRDSMASSSAGTAVPLILPLSPMPGFQENIFAGGPAGRTEASDETYFQNFRVTEEDGGMSLPLHKSLELAETLKSARITMWWLMMMGICVIVVTAFGNIVVNVLGIPKLYYILNLVVYYSAPFLVAFPIYGYTLVRSHAHYEKLKMLKNGRMSPCSLLAR